MQAGFDDFVPKPFRFERICKSLEELLGVEYQYAEQPGDEPDETPELELWKVTLPDNLLSQLREAAELYDMTELNKCLDQLNRLGSDGHQLWQHLRRLARNYEMDKITDILSMINA